MTTADKKLWRATAYQAGLGKLKIISMVSGIPLDALEQYVETGELSAMHRMMLQMCADG